MTALNTSTSILLIVDAANSTINEPNTLYTTLLELQRQIIEVEVLHGLAEGSDNPFLNDHEMLPKSVLRVGDRYQYFLAEFQHFSHYLVPSQRDSKWKGVQKALKSLWNISERRTLFYTFWDSANLLRDLTLE